MRRLSVVSAFTIMSLLTFLVAPAHGQELNPRDQFSQEIKNDQCAVSEDFREGAWFCPSPVSSRALRMKAEAGNGLSVANGVCAAIGCWYIGTATYAYFVGSGSYGYGGTKLGDTDFYIEDHLIGGGNTRSRPFRFESTRAVYRVLAEGERLYFSSAQPQGAPVSGGTYNQWGWSGPYAANQLVQCFGSAGYTAYEATVAHGGIVHQYNWSDTQYPGRYYLWVKSPKFHRQSNGNYRFDSTPQMGLNWYASGWSS